MLSKLNHTQENEEKEIEKLKTALAEADAVMIGAGSGLSASAGFTYTGERFEQYFKDFEAKFDFHDMYSGGFYPYPTPEELWSFWSRYIYVNRYTDPPIPLYDRLLDLVCDKDYFVLTTNVDHCFQKAGFSKKRLFYTQGDYGLFQCSTPCTQETFDNEQMVMDMMEQQEDMKIPTQLIPTCPNCGRPLTMNLRSDDKFVEDEGWHAACERYHEFVDRYKDKKILYLELGVGYNTPGIIKYNFWQQVEENPNATYACINFGEASAPEEIAERSICINGDIGAVIEKM